MFSLACLIGICFDLNYLQQKEFFGTPCLRGCITDENRTGTLVSAIEKRKESRQCYKKDKMLRKYKAVWAICYPCSVSQSSISLLLQLGQFESHVSTFKIHSCKMQPNKDGTKIPVLQIDTVQVSAEVQVVTGCINLKSEFC